MPEDLTKPSVQVSQDKKVGVPLEVTLPEESLQNYEVITMAKDLGSPQGQNVEPPQEEKRPVHPPHESFAPAQTVVPSLDEANEMPPRFSLRNFLVGFIGVLLVGFIGFGLYWYKGFALFSPSPTVVGPTIPTPIPPPPPLSFDSPLLAINKTLPIEVASAKETPEEFFGRVKDAIASITPQPNKGDLVRIYFHQEQKKVSLETLGNILNLIPPTLYAYINGESYTLLYEENADKPSFGLIVRVRDKQGVMSSLKAFEVEGLPLLRKIYQAYRGQVLPNASGNVFFDNEYQKVKIRYLNFPSAALAFDYAVYNDLLIIAGSRELMFTLLDRVKLSDL